MDCTLRIRAIEVVKTRGTEHDIIAKIEHVGCTECDIRKI